MFFTLTSSYYTGRYVMKSDWRVYGKKDKHKKRKGKRRAKHDIIADFNPYSI